MISRRPDRERGFRRLSAIPNLGSADVLVWLVVLTGILLLSRRRFRLAAYLAVTSSGGLVLDPTLKALIGRLRQVVPNSSRSVAATASRAGMRRTP